MFKPGDIIKYKHHIQYLFNKIILEQTNIDYKVCVLSGNSSYYPYYRNIEDCNQKYILATDIFRDAFITQDK